jgi:dTDP-4-dehydrorhamnose reductase
MLGHDLVAVAPKEALLFPTSHSELDIADYKAVTAYVTKVQPDLIINAAAYTAVDRAESERELAFKVNCEAVGALGKVAAPARVKVVHFSTDYVFDGTGLGAYVEESETSPVNAYGATKLAGEIALRESGADTLIIRTQWLFGGKGRSFPRTMWERAVQELPTKVVNDQTGRPTYTVDLAEATWRLVQAGTEGLVHIANSGSTSWYGLASHVFHLAGKPNLVTSCSTADYPTAARRPPNSVLSTLAAEARLGYRLPDWRHAVERFITSAFGKAVANL